MPTVFLLIALKLPGSCTVFLSASLPTALQSGALARAAANRPWTQNSSRTVRQQNGSSEKVVSGKEWMRGAAATACHLISV